MQETKYKEIIHRYIQERQESRPVGELYVSLALLLYQQGKNPDANVLKALEGFQDNSGVVLSKGDLQYLLEHKEECIDYICDSQQHDLLYERWLYMTPAAISRLCVALAKVKQDSRVYLPFLGLGSFADNLPDGCTIEGEEYDETVWALEKIREWSRSVEFPGLVCGDSYKRMKDARSAGRYDVVIMAPPYGFNSESKWGDDVAEALELCLEVLNDDGRIVMLAPEYFNTKGGFAELRERLLREGMVESVINFCEGLLMPATWGSACVWVMTKRRNESVTLVDASGCVLPRNGKSYCTLNAEAVIAIVEGEGSKAKILISSDQIDPEYVMPEKSKRAYGQLHRNVSTRVLWLDDDPSIVEEFKHLGRHRDIEVTHFESWDECEDMFCAHLHEWDAVILDANCKFHANDTEYSVNTFLAAAISRIERICYQNKVDIIPWYVLTEGKDATVNILKESLCNMERTWDNDREHKPFYLKNDKALLLDRIKSQRMRSTRYKVESQYQDVFRAIRDCGLTRVDDYMFNLLEPMYNGTSSTDYNRRFSDARKTLEAIFTDMIARQLLPESLRTSPQKGANLSWSSLILAGEEAEIEKVPKLKSMGISRKNCKGYGAYNKLMAYNVKSIIFAAGSFEHDQQIAGSEGKRTADTTNYLKDVNRSSHLIQSYALQLCDIILWYRNLIKRMC